MEPRFGIDFSNIRIHNAPDLASSIQAQAFTHGRDIYFNAGKYDPESSGGKRLLGHELAHAIQQSGFLQTKLTIGQPGDKYEQEADRVTTQIVDRIHPFQEHQVTSRQESHAGTSQRTAALQANDLVLSRPLAGQVIQCQTGAGGGPGQRPYAEGAGSHPGFEHYVSSEEPFTLHPIGAFVNGFLDGIKVHLSDEVYEEISKKIAFSTGLQPVLILGATVGIWREVWETIVGAYEFITNPEGFIDQIVNLLEILLNDSEAAKELGHQLGEEKSEQIAKSKDYNQFKFTFSLGEFVGPIALEIILAIITAVMGLSN